ncbi:MAG: hypothetical protein WCK67_10045 [bacterium]
MNKLFLILGSLILLHIIYIAVVNFGVHLDVHVLGKFSIHGLKLGLGIIMLSFYSFISSTMIFYYIYTLLSKKLKKQTRSVEKALIITEESTDRIKVLESKIQTLEKALKDALS